MSPTRACPRHRPAWHADDTGGRRRAGAYLRQPTLHGDCVVFVSEDDLWRRRADGGVAQRLTAGLVGAVHALPVARRALAGLSRP